MNFMELFKFLFILKILLKIHKGTGTVKESITSLYDGKALAIEEILEPETLCDDDRLIRIIQYYPEEHKVSKAKQVCFLFFFSCYIVNILFFFFFRFLLKKLLL